MPTIVFKLSFSTSNWNACPKRSSLMGNLTIFYNQTALWLWLCKSSMGPFNNKKGEQLNFANQFSVHCSALCLQVDRAHQECYTPAPPPTCHCGLWAPSPNIVQKFCLHLLVKSKSPLSSSHLDLGEGGEDGEAALHGHGDGGVDRARQADVDQGQQVRHQEGIHVVLQTHCM